MRTYVQKYNIFKHLPVFNLHEFSDIAKLLTEDDNEAKINALNYMAIVIRKDVRNYLKNNTEKTSDFGNLKFNYNIVDSDLLIEVKYSTNEGPNPYGKRGTPMCVKAITQIEQQTKLKDFLRFLFQELFVVQTFREKDDTDSTDIYDLRLNYSSIDVVVNRSGYQVTIKDINDLKSKIVRDNNC